MKAKTMKTNARTVSMTARTLGTLSTLGAALLPALIAGGCGSGNHTRIEEPTLSRARSLMTSNGLQVTLIENNYSIEVGQKLIYTLAVTNTTNAPITYYTRNDCGLQLLPEVDSGVRVTNIASKSEVVVGQPEVTCASIGSLESKELAPGASLIGSIDSTPAYGAHALTSAGDYEASATIAASFIGGGDTTAEPVTVGPLPVTVTE